MSETSERNDFDVVVIGGGAAGLSGALTLARARRSVLVLDAGEPRNAPAQGVHGFLSRDGIPPSELVRIGAAEVTHYGGQVLPTRATSVRRNTSGFTVDTASGQTFTARRMLITTGLLDELPDIPGLRERWGRDVLHCPYCHGWEVRDQPIGVLGTGTHVVRQALTFRQWSSDVMLFQHTAPTPTDEQREQLTAQGITIIEGQVTAIEVADDRITGLRLAEGQLVQRQAVAVMPRFTARSTVLADLGLTTVEVDGIGSRIETEANGLTSVPGVWAAGNVTDLMASVIMSAAAGVTAAMAINVDLIADDTRRAVTRHRAAYSMVNQTQTVS